MGAGDGCDRKPRLDLGDGAAQAGGIGVNGQREAACKTQVALDGQAKRQCYRRDLGKAGRTHFGATKAKVAKPEQNVAVFVQFGKQPCGRTHGRKEFDDRHMIAKFFNPVGAATWLFSKLDEDGDILFGLCDLGFGCPEMGSASLAEIAAVSLPFGLTIERDLCFEGRFPLTVYADAARLCGGITEDAARLEASAAARANAPSELPPP